jgi:histone-lysine N-methyltransferase SETD3
MALLLLRERNLGAASTCAPYIASLPQRALATPHRWSDSQLTALRDAAFIARIKSQQKDIAAQWHTLCATAPSNCIAASFTAADFSWAVDMVRSRTFSGPYEGSDWSDRVRLGVLLLALTAAYVLTGAGPLENGLSGLLAGGAFILLKDAATQALPNAPRRYIMAPVLDLCNHRPGVVSDLTYQYFANCFELILGSGAQQPGEEVFVSYGAHSAEELLQLYGFVDCGVPNVDDVITLTADDVNNAPADAADAACRQTLAQACPLTITRRGEVVPALEARIPLTEVHSRAIAAILGAKYTSQQAAADAEVVRVAKARRSAFANDELDADAALLAAQFCAAKNETAREAILALTAAR